MFAMFASLHSFRFSYLFLLSWFILLPCSWFYAVGLSNSIPIFIWYIFGCLGCMLAASVLCQRCLNFLGALILFCFGLIARWSCSAVVDV